MNFNADLKTFVENQVSELALNIDYNPEDNLPKKTEDFVEKVLKDDRGRNVTNEKVHIMMHKFRRKAKRRGYTRLLILGAFQHGKSMGKNTKILMFSGEIKNVQDIEVGDQVMGDDSTPRNVLFLGRGKEPMYRIHLKNGDYYDCNESHILALKVSNRVWGLRKGEKITVNLSEYLDFPGWIKKNCLKHYKVPVKFKRQSIPFDPYLYGCWLGDGGKNKFTFTINDIDKEIVKKIYRWSDKHGFEVNDYQEKGCTTYRINLGENNSKSYKELDFLKSSFVNEEKRINKRYLINSKLIRLQLLAGLIDTDGYKIKTHRGNDACFEITTKYKGLRDDILYLCRSLGFHVSHKEKWVEEKKYFRIYIGGEINRIPCKTRKRAEEKEGRQDYLSYGFDVEVLGEGEYYGFGLDGNHHFLLGDFTVVHNTEQMCIGLCLEEIAKNPNIFIKIVHVSEKEAINRVRAIGEYVKNDNDFKNLCPHIRPSSIFGQEKFIIERKTISLNPTVQAFACISGSIGGRAHLIILDDPQDLKSAVMEPTTRENIEKMVKNVWETRLITGPKGNESEMIVLMNRWHRLDLVNYIQNNSMWAWMSLSVAEDKETLVYEDSFKKKKNIPLWSKFPKKLFKEKHITLGDRDYNRGFRLIPYTDEDKSFPSFESCCSYGFDPINLITDLRDWVFCAGIDFASPKRPGTTMVVGAMNRNSGLKIPIEAHMMNHSSELPNKMVNVWKNYGVEMFLCENNSVQSSIIDLLQSHLDSSKFRKYNIKLEGFYTGRNKVDPGAGLPSLQKEMEKKEWAFYYKRKFTIEDNFSREPWYIFYTEFLHHPFFDTTDFVMSTWFLRNAFTKIFIKEANSMIY